MVEMDKKCLPRVCGFNTLCGRAYECFDTNTNHLGCFTNLKQYGTVEDFIAAFEQLDFCTKGMFDSFFWECFISGLKDEIHAHVLMDRPQSWVDATKRAKEAQQVVSSQN